MAAGAPHGLGGARASIASRCTNFTKFARCRAAARHTADAVARSDNTGRALEPPAVPGPAPGNLVRLSNNTVLYDWPPYHVDIKALLAALSTYRLAVVQDLSSAYARLSSLAQDRLFFVASCYTLCYSGRYVDQLYGDTRRRCNEPVKELPEFAAAFRCNLPYTQS
ncbi:hypothetical protein MRX96_038906 [Rhipicephalus microplus]